MLARIDAAAAVRDKLIATIEADARAPQFRRFRSASGEHLLIVPHTRDFRSAAGHGRGFDADSRDAERLVTMLGETTVRDADLAAVVTPAPQSLSLNVSSSCNLACGYCYADPRRICRAGRDQTMTFEVASAAVARLLAGADPARPITIGFLGGEPLAQPQPDPGRRDLRRLPRAATSPRPALFDHDQRHAASRTPTFELFRNHRFAVTVSVDGDAVAHDAQRPFRNGAGSFAQLAKRVQPLLAEPGLAQVAARA